jgi:hypothetical protein
MEAKELLICVALVAVSAGAASAQWLDYPTPGIPRGKDGKVNLKAPVPKDAAGKPDMSGLWQKVASPWAPPPNDATQGFGSMSAFMPPGAPESEILMKPEAAALYKKRADAWGAGRPSEFCLPHTVPDQMFITRPLRMIQTKYFTAMLWEELNNFRMIYTDGRPHPKDMSPSWFGYSIGKWDGDAFVVDTRGFNDKSWLDDAGHPHTEQMHTIETFRRPDFGHMKVEIAIDDPGAYEKAMKFYVNFQFLADSDLVEEICENERDRAHIAVPK